MNGTSLAANSSKNSLFLEKLQKSKHIEKLSKEFPGVTAKKNWVFLPDIIIKEKFIKASNKILQEKAAKRIQSTWRVYLLRKAFSVHMKKLQNTAHILQKYFNDGNKRKQKLNRYLKAVVRIQSWWRGQLIRRQTVSWCYSKIYSRLDTFKEMRDKYLKQEIEYYCNLWKQKVKDNKIERKLHARKAFVYYAITVYEKLRKKRSRQKHIVKSKETKPKARKSIIKGPQKGLGKLKRSNLNVNKFKSAVKNTIKNKNQAKKNPKADGNKLDVSQDDRPTSLVKSKTFQKGVMNKVITKMLNKAKINVVTKSGFKDKKTQLENNMTKSPRKGSHQITEVIHEEENKVQERDLNSASDSNGVLSPEIRVTSPPQDNIVKVFSRTLSPSKNQKEEESVSIAT
eukprot:CAMPEP_0197018100 /NCGR_PEP_ID=MMETSP1380-20130617/79911_1 /TAXON_ID=5936 /ORGANISM="Euplotes crassus, Strain CT5" /LENGTH=397 /DNA_ID=CAMNT_0042445275 /DNA_START=403 /DNA_END=1594 /DNA_ORIENTATION=-